jgi:hypothetical protein
MKNLKYFWRGDIPVFLICLCGACGGSYIGSYFGLIGIIIGGVLGFVICFISEMINTKTE